MREFAIYSLLRLGLFLAVLAVVGGVWLAVFGSESSILWPLVIAFLLSGLLSLFWLNSPREAFAQRVQGRADRAAAKLHDLKSKEDDPDVPHGAAAPPAPEAREQSEPPA